MISHAMVNGRSHRLRQQNSHDFAISGSPRPGTAFGLVLDGCGSKYNRQPSNNEVGAKLLGQFAAGWLEERLAVSDEPLAVADLVNGLFADCTDFLQQTTALLPFADEAAWTRFVMTHWLATLVGFVVTEETAVLFWQGDGYLCVNGEVTTLDSGNQPDYLAYRLLSGGAFTTPAPHLPCPPANYQILVRENLHMLVVATDGWQPDLLTQLTEPRSSLHLQRRLNVQARQPGNFEDDGAIATWWLVTGS